MSRAVRQARYKAAGGGADLVPVEVLVPPADRDLVLRYAEKLRAKYRAGARRAAGRYLLLAEYPQLSLIAWSRPQSESISELDAFNLYERNWRFVDRGALRKRENALIGRLIKKYGNGVLNV